MIYRENISKAMVDALAHDRRAVIIGQNVTTQHGVFGTTTEAYAKFPTRVLEAPISETMLTGMCVGMAMEGWKPILVHTRADFSLFSFEHLINTAAKFQFLHGKPLPFIMRCVVGRGWGQGPVHSQSWHHLLAQIPGLDVFMPVFPEMYGEYIYTAMYTERPTVIFESRRLYETELRVGRSGLPDINLFTYGDAAIDAFQAAAILEMHGVFAQVFPIENMGFGLPLPGAKNQLIIDIAPRPRADGLLSPPFAPLGVSRPLDQAWYPTAQDIVLEACRILGRIPPEMEVTDARSLAAPVQSVF